MRKIDEAAWVYVLNQIIDERGPLWCLVTDERPGDRALVVQRALIEALQFRGRQAIFEEIIGRAGIGGKMLPLVVKADVQIALYVHGPREFLHETEPARPRTPFLRKSLHSA